MWVRKAGFLAVVTLIPAGLLANTWDEPWMDKVITNSESFVRVKVLDNGPEAVKATMTKHLAGSNTPSEINLTGFIFVSLHSDPYGESDLQFEAGSEYYLFLKKSAKGTGYLIATPTTGWAKVGDKGVYATYRHSYHQALVPAETYEMTMVAIFNKVHGIKGDDTPVLRFITTELSKAPEVIKGSSEETTREFFLQHAALETFRYFGSETNLGLIDPFLQVNDIHAQISAVRAISGVRSQSACRRLMAFIEAKRYGFGKVMAVWGLKDQGAKSMLPRLKQFLKDGEDEKTGFGGNVMDPRVGTRFPSSVKEAIKELVEAWSK
jgi:hypothetical protein